VIGAILLDIEGTTSSVSFVYETLFPYAREHLHDYLHHHWGEPELKSICELIISDADTGSATILEDVERAVLSQMDRDAKLTGLKQLQGRIWKAGFESGELKAHVYPDTPVALARWKKALFKVFIYSSGSIEAQKLFFAHTICGDLTPLLDGYFDTTSGDKRQSESYLSIARATGMQTADMLFISDIEAELNAARAAGMQTALSVRDDAVIDSSHQIAKTFDRLPVNPSLNQRL
jgi:enolase-phosphatase E1